TGDQRPPAPVGPGDQRAAGAGQLARHLESLVPEWASKKLKDWVEEHLRLVGESAAALSSWEGIDDRLRSMRAALKEHGYPAASLAEYRKRLSGQVAAPP